MMMTGRFCEPMPDFDTLKKTDPPGSVAEAIARLMDILDEGTKRAIAGQEETDLIDFHFGLGQAIRNAWLWKGNSPLLSDCGVSHPDDASLVIIRGLWTALRTSGPIR